MRIALVVTGLTRTGDHSATSDHASTRLRALIPAPALARRGHTVLIFADVDLRDGVVARNLGAGDVLILHKCRPDVSNRLDEIRAAGVSVIVDVCDHVFIHPVLSTFYPALLERADVATVATAAMGAIVEARTGLPIHVIADALEGRRSEPSGICEWPSRPLRLMWFGRSQNARPLVDLLPSLQASLPAELEVVTDGRAGLPKQIAAAAPEGLAVTVTPWSLEALDQALARAEVVLVPRDLGDGHMIKSANRLERSIWGGRVVVAAPSPSSEEWRDVAFLDFDLAAALKRALDERDGWTNRTHTGQERLIRLRSADALAALWEAAAADADGKPSNTRPS